MILRSTFIAIISLSVSAAYGKDSKDNMSPAFVETLNQVAALYKAHDCDEDFSETLAKNIVDACKEAHETPEVASKHGVVSCIFDLQNYSVSVQSTSVSPEYQISPSGDVKKISKGALSVSANACKKLTLEMDEAVGHHSYPSAEDLCLSYFPDKHFSDYQERPECANNDERKPASNTHVDDPSDEDSDSSDVALDASNELASYEAVVR